MSSISMGLNGHGISIDNKPSNPGTLNAWLKANRGYTQGDDLEESALPRINASTVSWPSDGMHTANDLSVDIVRGYLLRGRTVVANVMNGGHFVLVVGFNYSAPTQMMVHDPGFTRASYDYKADIMGWRVFDLNLPL